MADIFDPNQIAFGRLEAPDVRDNLYPMALALEAEAPLPRYKHWPMRAALDQGSTSGCTGASARTDMEAGPNMVKIGVGPTWQEIYKRAQQLDPFPGEEPTMKGSTVRAAMQALQEWGYVETYVWAQSIEDVKRFVLTKGPVICGTSWLSDMMTPDSSNRLRVTGNVVGGHAYCVCGYTSSTRLFRIQNTWSRGWGVNGKAWIAEDDLARLITQGGEAVAPTEKIAA